MTDIYLARIMVQDNAITSPALCDRRFSIHDSGDGHL